MAVGHGEIFALAPHFRLQWEEVPQKHVLLYPEGMVELSETAAEILIRCDGKRAVHDIIEDLQGDFESTEIAKDVTKFLEEAAGRGWITVQRDE